MTLLQSVISVIDRVNTAETKSQSASAPDMDRARGAYRSKIAMPMARRPQIMALTFWNGECLHTNAEARSQVPARMLISRSFIAY